MWAVRLIAPATLEMIDVPAPQPADVGAGQVLLRMCAGGICGSDIPRFRGLKRAPAQPGNGGFPSIPGYPLHEVVGEVVVSRHDGILEGATVVGWSSHDDGLAEYVVADGSQLAAFRASLPAERAVLIQSIACVLFAVEQLSVRGAHVTVLGLGPIGLLFAHVLRDAGVGRLTGVDIVDRSEVAEGFGLDAFVHTTSAEWARTIDDAERPEIVVEAIGHQTATLQHAIDGVAATGRIVYFGIPDDPFYPLDMERVMRKNLTLTGGVTRRRAEMLRAADMYLAAHPSLYELIVTDLFPVSRIQEAYDRAALTDVSRRKVIVTMR